MVSEFINRSVALISVRSVVQLYPGPPTPSPLRERGTKPEESRLALWRSAGLLFADRRAGVPALPVGTRFGKPCFGKELTCSWRMLPCSHWEATRISRAQASF